MKIMVAEYAVGTANPESEGWSTLLREGRAMLTTLKQSFERAGNEVISPIGVSDFEAAVAELSKECDAGIVIAPDELLTHLTELVESNTVNLGCSSHCVRICADKLRTTEILSEAGIPVPGIIRETATARRCVTKPRYGCASEGVFIRDKPPGYHLDGSGSGSESEPITVEYIGGEAISSSVVAGPSGILPLTVNKQFIQVEQSGRIRYTGGLVPYHMDAEREREIFARSKQVVAVLGCEGYVGIDFVLREGDGRAFVVDVNPRPTTSIVGIGRVLNYELGDLLLGAKFGSLPGEEEIKTEGCFIFNL